METLFLFTNGGGSTDPLNWAKDEAIILSSSDLVSIKPSDSRTLELNFNSATVELKIRNGGHLSVMKSIASAISSTQIVATIIDKDKDVYIHRDIYDVTIKHSVKKSSFTVLSNNSRTNLAPTNGAIKNCIISNTHSADVTCKLELYDGSSYYTIMNAMVVPTNATLVLEGSEISFDEQTYSLHGTSGNASGLLNFMFNYI
tara:strand:- start:686 stop:1288 length:603 start_codon:yes stop_codon:yes gene_type:complete